MKSGNRNTNDRMGNYKGSLLAMEITTNNTYITKNNRANKHVNIL